MVFQDNVHLLQCGKAFANNSGLFKHEKKLAMYACLKFGTTTFCQKDHIEHAARHKDDKYFVYTKCRKSTQNLLCFSLHCKYIYIMFSLNLESLF